ncbi:MAG: hypothetical protein JW808_09375, partial [Victivallales bacterium]|nr:hypothetical protein [Victivallales bacterium]
HRADVWSQGSRRAMVDCASLAVVANHNMDFARRMVWPVSAAKRRGRLGHRASSRTGMIKEYAGN